MSENETSSPRSEGASSNNKPNWVMIAAGVVAAIVLVVVGVLVYNNANAEKPEDRFLNSEEIAGSGLLIEGSPNHNLIGWGKTACNVADLSHSELPKGDDGVALSHFETFHQVYMQVNLPEAQAKDIWIAADAFCPERGLRPEQ